MEYLDICDERGQPIGEIVDRDAAHKNGILHRTSHVWVIRERDGQYDILLQKRSRDKESFPGMYDASSAGHIPAGSDPLHSMIREMGEEIGIHAKPDELAFAGTFHCSYEERFRGEVFRDNEIRYAYVYREPVNIEELTLQKSEVEEVRWFPLDEVADEIRTRQDRICVSRQGMSVLMDYLKGVHDEKERIDYE